MEGGGGGENKIMGVEGVEGTVIFILLLLPEMVYTLILLLELMRFL